MKGLRFLLIRNWENLGHGEKGWVRDLERVNRRLFRAWQLKEELRDILGMGIIKARGALDTWIHYASRSRLPAFVKLAQRIRRYRASLEATIEWGLTNGIAESNNSVIGAIRTQARGFHQPDKFIVMIMLARGGLRPDLPWTPTQTP